MILGEKSLRKMKAQINLFEYKLYYSIPKEEQKIQRVNFTNNSLKYVNKINELMEKNEQVYPNITIHNRNRSYNQNSI